jgi:hypothetical protein
MAKTLDQNLPDGTPRGRRTWNEGAVPHAEESPAAVVPAVPAPHRPLPYPLSQALCDLVTDPDSGITRVTIAGASARTVADLEELAAERGLQTQSASSPSLDRGWIRIDRGERTETTGE